MNLLHYDEWKGTNAVRVLTNLLEAVYSEFVEKASGVPFLEKAVRFAEGSSQYRRRGSRISFLLTE